MEQEVPVTAAMRTDTGLVRSHNEDYCLAYVPEESDTATENSAGRVYLVADGVGGAEAGEVASRYASERTLHHYREFVVELDAEIDAGQQLIAAMQAANTDLRRLAASRTEQRRMATTMVGVVILGNAAVIANVGDSRAYLWRAGTFSQITKDQSLVAQLMEEGAITAEQAANHPHRNIILSSIGSERRPPIDRYDRTLLGGDLLLLCSDGLTRHVEDIEIEAIVGSLDIDTAVDDLVDLALDRGGQDNITVAIVQYGSRQGLDPVVDSASGQSPRLLSLTLALAAIMVVLIMIIWFVVQQSMAI